MPNRSQTPPVQSDSLTPVLGRNIEALYARRQAAARNASGSEKLATVITRATGSLGFVLVHIVLVALWTLVNSGTVTVVMAPFDPSFVGLATIASVEAIFLTAFVLISQNRAAAAADQRDELELQVTLLAEHEITHLLMLTRAIADRLGIDAARDPSLDPLEDHIAPEQVLDEIEERDPLA